MKVDVIGTAAAVTPSRIERCDAAVIDVFRATSVIVTAFMNGAGEIIPVTGIEDAFRVKAQLQEQYARDTQEKRILLGGERKTEQIEGFDLDNSPLRYSRQAVAGATIVMSTTNGTRALNRAQDRTEGEIYVGSFLNADAVCRRLGGSGRDVALVCSGRQDRFTIEDGLCAGMMARYLVEYFDYRPTDFAWWCTDLYERWQWDIPSVLDHCEHYRAIRERWAQDIEWCLRRNITDATPRVDRETGAIR